MSKKFVVALNGVSHLRDPITEYFVAKGWRVWHWYADLWLLADVPDELTAGTLYEGVEQAVPQLKVAPLIVLEMDEEFRHFGRAPDRPNGNGWAWMKEYWGEPDIPHSYRQLATPIPETEKVES